MELKPLILCNIQNIITIVKPYYYGVETRPSLHVLKTRLWILFNALLTYCGIETKL